MNQLSTSEIIKLFNEIRIPAELRFAEDRYKNFTKLSDAIQSIDLYNTNRKDELYIAVEHLMTGVRDLIEYSQDHFVDFNKAMVAKQLELKKKDHTIDALKSFNDFRREQESPKKKPKLKRRSPPPGGSDDQPSEKEIRRLMKMV